MPILECRRTFDDELLTQVELSDEVDVSCVTDELTLFSWSSAKVGPVPAHASFVLGARGIRSSAGIGGRFYEKCALSFPQAIYRRFIKR